MKKGAINLKQGETLLALSPQPFLDVEVKAVRKKGKEKVSFEIAWRTTSDTELSISSQ
jgi:amphi-Trp domain-containing protein